MQRIRELQSKPGKKLPEKISFSNIPSRKNETNMLFLNHNTLFRETLFFYLLLGCVFLRDIFFRKKPLRKTKYEKISFRARQKVSFKNVSTIKQVKKTCFSSIKTRAFVKPCFFRAKKIIFFFNQKTPHILDSSDKKTIILLNFMLQYFA